MEKSRSVFLCIIKNTSQEPEIQIGENQTNKTKLAVCNVVKPICWSIILERTQMLAAASPNPVTGGLPPTALSLG